MSEAELRALRAERDELKAWAAKAGRWISVEEHERVKSELTEAKNVIEFYKRQGDFYPYDNDESIIDYGEKAHVWLKKYETQN